MKKRILSLALVLIFALTLAPLAIAADVSPHPHATVPTFQHDSDVQNFSINSIPASDYAYVQQEVEGMNLKMWVIMNSTYLLYAESDGLNFIVFTDGWAYVNMNTAEISAVMKMYIGNMDSVNSLEALNVLQGLGDYEKLSAMDIYAIVELSDGTKVEVFPDGCTRVKLPDGTEAFVTADGEIVDPIVTTPPAPMPPVAVLNAAPNASAVYVDGKATAFDAYTINNENYFKLRDVAFVLNGSRVQFDASWDGAANMISLTSGKAYTPDGSEMKAKGTESKTPVLNKSKIMLNGKEVELTAYTIDGNNYFKMRELAQTFNFGVGYDSATKSITVDTTKTYTP